MFPVGLIVENYCDCYFVEWFMLYFGCSALAAALDCVGCYGLFSLEKSRGGM